MTKKRVVLLHLQGLFFCSRPGPNKNENLSVTNNLIWRSLKFQVRDSRPIDKYLWILKATPTKKKESECKARWCSHNCPTQNENLIKHRLWVPIKFNNKLHHHLAICEQTSKQWHRHTFRVQIKARKRRKLASKRNLGFSSTESQLSLLFLEKSFRQSYMQTCSLLR